MRKRHKAVPALAESLFAAAWSTFGGKRGSGELVSFVLEEVVARETDSREAAAVTPAMQVHCLREAAEAVADARLAKSFKSADLPKILYALTSEVSPFVCFDLFANNFYRKYLVVMGGSVDICIFWELPKCPLDRYCTSKMVDNYES